MRTVACRDCGAAIFWAITPNDKRMPIDAQPAQFGGNIVALDLAADVPMIRVLKKGEQTPGQTQRWKSHFTTCSAAKARRKR